MDPPPHIPEKTTDALSSCSLQALHAMYDIAPTSNVMLSLISLVDVPSSGPFAEATPRCRQAADIEATQLDMPPPLLLLELPRRSAERPAWLKQTKVDSRHKKSKRRKKTEAECCARWASALYMAVGHLPDDAIT